MSLRRWTLALAFVALTLVATAGLATAQKPTPPPPDYFPLAKGYTWDYESTTDAGKKSNFTIRVLGSEKTADGAVLWQVATEMVAMAIHDYYTKPAGWVLRHRQVYTSNQMTGEFKPVQQFLKNPLGAGATWSWKGTGMMDVEIEESHTVSGPETVVVPAGKFSCMKVTSDVLQGGQQVKKVYWYADHVGMVKSQTESGGVKSTTVLLKYSFKGKG